MILSKKGFATSLFKWIFAVVAGALVLTFLIGFAFQQQKTADNIDDKKIITRLEHQLEALGTSDVATKTLPLNDETTLQFDCDGMQIGTYRKKMDKIIFAPPSLTGSALHTWVEQWNFPYKADTFYYVSNRNTRTLLVYDVTTFPYVLDLNVPRSFNAQLIDINDFDPLQVLPSVRGLDSFTLVFFTPQASIVDIFEKFQRVPLTIIEVNSVSHEVTIHTPGFTEDTYYLDESMLYGLFFAPEQYVCLKDKALGRLRDVTTIYEQKTDLLASKLGGQPICQQLLLEGKQLLSIFRTATANDQLDTYATAIASHNRELEKHDCPTIY